MSKVPLRMCLTDLCDSLQDMVITPISNHPTLNRAMTGRLMTLHSTTMKEVGKHSKILTVNSIHD